MRKAAARTTLAGLVLASVACASTRTVQAPPQPTVVPRSAWVNGQGQADLLAVQQDLVNLASDAISSTAVIGDAGNLEADAAQAALLPVPGDPQDYETAMRDLSSAGMSLAAAVAPDGLSALRQGEQELDAALRTAAWNAP